MRATLVIPDNLMIVDDTGPETIDLSELAAEGQHAVQWYGTWGEVEFAADPASGSHHREPNQRIEDFSPYQKYLDAYNEAVANRPPIGPMMMADYRLTTPDPDGPVQRAADGACIPNDPANADWQQYQRWLEDGGVPDPYIPPPEPEPVRDPNQRLDDGVTAAQEVMNQPPTNFTPTQKAVDVDALQAQVNQLQAAVKAMLEAHGLPP